jgi:hypothetical protein
MIKKVIKSFEDLKGYLPDIRQRRIERYGGRGVRRLCRMLDICKGLM